MGIPHPPGHPWYTAATNPFGLFPWGSIALRMNLASGFFTAVACATLATVARRQLERLGLTAPRAAVASLCGALLAGSSYALWFQGVRAEVYALHLATVTLLVALTIEMDAQARDRGRADARLLYGMALVSGLGLANHHYLMIFAGIVVLGLMLSRTSLRGLLLSPRGLWGFGFGLLGFMVYLVLPLRAARNPYINWGNLRTLDDFIWMVTAQAFQKSVERVHQVDVPQLITDLLVQMARQTTPVGLLFALLGLGWLITDTRHRSTGLLLGGFLTLNLLTQSLMNFDPNNPDVHGYFALSAWIIALLVTLALGRFGLALQEAALRESRPNLQQLGPWLGRSSVALLAVLAAINTVLTLPEARLDDFHDVDQVNMALLALLPPGALVLTSNYKTAFNLWYAQGVEHRRPDVALVHRNFFANAPYIRELEHRHPGALPLVERPGLSNRLHLPALRAMAAVRPVYVEYDINIEPELLPFLIPEGYLFRVSPEPWPATALPPAIVQRQVALWSALGRRLQRPNTDPPYALETGRYLVWQHYLATLALLDAGHHGLAQFHLDQAMRINDASPELRALARRLRPQAIQPTSPPSPGPPSP
ncbi:MAG: DUF2723 domain-containing protein, partial [Myxococcota bacterium]